MGAVESGKSKLANTWKLRMETTEYLMEERLKWGRKEKEDILGKIEERERQKEI